MTIENTATIYNTPGVYNQGQGGGGGGSFVGISEKNFEVWSTSNNRTRVNITSEYIIGIPNFGVQYSDSWRWAVEPIYNNKVTWDDLNIGDEIEINAVVNCPRIGTNRTDFFGPSNYFGTLNTTDSYKFEINNYDGTSWFYILGNLRGTQFNFNFNTDVTINLVMKKIDSETFNFVGKYNGETKYSGNLSASSSTRADMVLPTFGNPSGSSSMMCGCKLLLGSFIRYNENILFGKQL